jgi:hypothetical protein
MVPVGGRKMPLRFDGARKPPPGGDDDGAAVGSENSPLWFDGEPKPPPDDDGGADVGSEKSPLWFDAEPNPPPDGMAGGAGGGPPGPGPAGKALKSAVMGCGPCEPSGFTVVGGAPRGFTVVGGACADGGANGEPAGAGGIVDRLEGGSVAPGGGATADGGFAACAARAADARNTWLHLLQRTRMGPLASLSSPTLKRV